MEDFLFVLLMFYFFLAIYKKAMELCKMEKEDDAKREERKGEFKMFTIK